MATSCEILSSTTKPTLTTTQHHALVTLTLAAIMFALPMSSIAEAQTFNPETRIVEWDCPLTGQEAPAPPVDPFPGALVTEGNLAWFVTRGEPRLVRFTPGAQRETATATCNWWDLDPLTVTTGGLRFKPYSGQAFIRGITDITRIATTTNTRTRWVDGLISLSDVAVKVNGTTSVYTTGSTSTSQACIDDPLTCLTVGQEGPFVVQRFNVNGNGSGTVTRWVVGGGAGSVQYSGIDVHPYSGDIYYSEPIDSNIGRLDPNTGAVRRWSLSSIGVTTPRQIDIDSAGMIWVTAGDGVANAYLVRLNPTTNQALKAEIPLGFLSTPVALDADGVIGFTTDNGIERVGMLTPAAGILEDVDFSDSTITSVNVPLSATPVTITQFIGPATPVVKLALATQTPTADGEFIEALIDLAVVEDIGDCGVPLDPDYPEDPCAASTSPQGIANDPLGSLGMYYTAIGNSVLRIAHVTLPSPAAGLVTATGRTALNDPITGLPAGTGTFSLTAYRTGTAQPVKGSLTYTAPGGNVTSLTITDLSFAGNTATVTGLCKPGSSCSTFKLTLVDGGWQTSSDQFRVIRNPILGLGVEEGGVLSSGSVKIWHQ